MAQMVKKKNACNIRDLSSIQETLDQEDPWRREWLLNSPVYLPGKFHGQSLAGYGSWGHKDLDTTE